MRAFHWFLIATALLLAVKVHRVQIYPDASFTPDYDSIVVEHRGIQIYGSSLEEIRYFGQLLDLVDYFDQEILGEDLPTPTAVFLKREIWSGTNRAYGVANTARAQIALESGRDVIGGAETIFHECLHLRPGWGVNKHPQIYELQGWFGNLLKSYGY